MASYSYIRTYVHVYTILCVLSIVQGGGVKSARAGAKKPVFSRNRVRRRPGRPAGPNPPEFSLLHTRERRFPKSQRNSTRLSGRPDGMMGMQAPPAQSHFGGSGRLKKNWPQTSSSNSAKSRFHASGRRSTIFREKTRHYFENGPPTVVADCPWQDTATRGDAVPDRSRPASAGGAGRQNCPPGCHGETRRARGRSGSPILRMERQNYASLASFHRSHIIQKRLEVQSSPTFVFF